MISFFGRQFSTFSEFLKHPSNSLSYVRRRSRASKEVPRILVPKEPATRQQCKSLISELNTIHLAFNVDPIYQISLWRRVACDYLNRNYYRGYSSPPSVMTDSNPTPSSVKSIDELKFDTELFFLSDPLFQKERQTMSLEKFNELVENYYSANQERGVQRLQEQYKIAPQFSRLMEQAHNQDKEIYLIGMSQYAIRRLIAAYYSLAHLKVVFMKCLKKVDEQQLILNEKEFYKYCRQQVYYLIYDNYLSAIEHSHLQKMLSLLPKDTTLVSHSYSHPSSKTSIKMSSMAPSTPWGKYYPPVDQDPDYDRIEKQAILEVMFGPLWTLPITNDPFPYLTEKFSKLGSQDQTLIKGCFQEKFKLYMHIVSQKLFIQETKVARG